jgi:hypothetical protein
MKKYLVGPRDAYFADKCFCVVEADDEEGAL